MTHRHLTFFIPLTLSAVLICGGCSMLKPHFDPAGYQNAATIQQQALKLMALAPEPFEKHRQETFQLMTRVELAYEHSLTRYKNDNVTGTWDRLRDPAGSRLGGFIALWERLDKLPADTITQYLKWVDDDFKMLISLETSKAGTPKSLQAEGGDKK